MRVLRGQREPAHGQPQRRVVVPRGLVADLRDLAADHHPRQAGRGFGARVGARDDAAVAQHGGGLAQAAHLVELVRDVEQRAALGAQAGQRRKQALDLLRRQHRGRLVEHQQPRVLHQAAHDLDALALADRQPPDLAPRVERQPVGAREFGDPLGHRRHRHLVIDRQGDVLGDAEVVEQREMLEDDTDAERARRARVGQRDGLALPEDLAGVGLQQAVEHLDQGRLARAVLAEQRVDLAGVDAEVDAVVGDQRAKALDEVAGLHQRAGGRWPWTAVARVGFRPPQRLIHRWLPA